MPYIQRRQLARLAGLTMAPSYAYRAGGALRSRYRGARSQTRTRTSRRRRRSANPGFPYSNRHAVRLTKPDAGGQMLNALNTRQPSIAPGSLTRLLSYERAFQKNIQASGAGIKPYNYCKQVFAETVNLGDGAAQPFAETFLLNSTFEPLEGASTHQPLGRDLMATIYNDYTVLGCKWRVVLRNITESGARAWIHMDTASTSNVASYQEAMERPDVQVVHLSSSAENDANETASLEGYCKTKNYMLSTGSLSDQYTAGVGANPSTPVRLHIQIERNTGTAIALNSIVADVQLQYYVVYSTVVGTTES